MNAAKSQCGRSIGRMRNSFSCHKCWVLILSHLSDVNQRIEEDVSKHFPVHRELAKTPMKRDAEPIELVLQWFEEIKPFDNDRDKELLMSFSTGFTSTADDSVNAERAAEVGMEMQIKLDGQSVTSTMDVKSKIKAQSSLRKSPLVNEKKMQLDSLKLFNRLIIFTQRDMTVDTSLQYELTPFPWLQTTQPTSGGAVTADSKLLCKLCLTSPPPAMGSDLPFFGHASNADLLDGWRCCSQKRVMSRPSQVRQL